jgi:diguanylate cyclase (GGDEF)-like protein
MARWYVTGVIVLGFLALLVSAVHVPEQNPALCALFLVLAAFVSLAKVELRVPRSMSTLTVTYVVDYLALLVVGPHVAALTAAVGAWSQCTLRRRHANPTHQTMFSMAALALAVYAAGAASAWFGPGSDSLTELQSVVVGATVLFGVNSWLIAGAIAVTTGQSAFYVWTHHFVPTWPGFLLGAFVAAGGAAGIARSGLWIIPIMVVAAALTCLKLRTQAARAEPVSDPLSGLAELGLLHSQGAHEITRARRQNSALVVCALAVDGLRAITDRAPRHHGGEHALSRLIQQLNAAGGAYGICASSEGDEFAMLLPDHHAADVRPIVDGVRAAVAGLEKAGGAPSALGISVGVAEFPRDGVTVDELLRRAAERMYQNKAARCTMEVGMPVA